MFGENTWGMLMFILPEEESQQEQQGNFSISYSNFFGHLTVGDSRKEVAFWEYGRVGHLSVLVFSLWTVTPGVFVWVAQRGLHSYLTLRVCSCSLALSTRFHFYSRWAPGSACWPWGQAAAVWQDVCILTSSAFMHCAQPLFWGHRRRSLRYPTPCEFW